MLNIWLTDAEYALAVETVAPELGRTLEAMYNKSQPNAYGQRLFKLTPLQWAEITINGPQSAR